MPPVVVAGLLKRANPAQRTVAGALGTFQGQYATGIPLLSAGSLVILVPTIIVFPILRRQFVSALLSGSLKGRLHD